MIDGLTVLKGLEYVFIILTGLSIGSFVTALSWRLPRGLPYAVDARGEPIRSLCPPCGRRLTPGELIPVLSWALQRGRCACGKTQISPRYPLIELLALIYTLILYRTQGLDLLDTPVYLITPYALAMAVIAAEGGRWTPHLLLPLLGGTAFLGVIAWAAISLPAVIEVAGVLGLTLLMFQIPALAPISPKNGDHARLAFALGFLAWLAFFPIFST